VPFVILTTLLAGLEPQLLLQLALNVPLAFTVMLLLVEPLLHNKLPVQPLAVIVATSLPQILVLSGVITGAFGAVPFVMVTTLLAGLEPQLLLQLALNVPLAFTVMLLLVEPLLHNKLPVQPLAVIVATSLPQIFVLSGVITGAFGAVPFVMVTTLLAGLEPQLLLQLALNVPLAFTVMLAVVAPLLHNKLPVQPLAVIVATSLPQILVLSGVITGAFGLLSVLISKTAEATLLPQLLLQVAEYVPANT
jgi:hypothetical protein